MVRTQIQLTEAQAAALKRLSGREGVSMAELIRMSIDLFLREKDAKDAGRERILLAKEASGKYSSGMTDLSEGHDRYFPGED